MKLTFENRDYPIDPGETVLDCLLRHEQAISHSCKAGACQSCMLLVTGGTVPEKSREGLKETLKARGCFLSCQCVPEEHIIAVRADGADICTKAVLLEKKPLNHNTLLLRAKPLQDMDSCRPGQYFTVINSDLVDRCYSIANDPALDGFVEFHVRLIPGGRMSEWLKEAEPSDSMYLRLRGPTGDCFYTADENQSFPIVMAGTGTGLAPLYGIGRDALRLGHTGPIVLYHGALREEDLYLVEELKALADKHSNFSYRPCVLKGQEGCYYTAGHIEDVVIRELPADKARTRLYICGAADFVISLRKKAFMDGLSSRFIYSDTF